MPVAGDPGCIIAAGAVLRPPVAWPGQRPVQFAVDQLLDELPDPITNPGLDWIKPVVEKMNSRLGCRLQGIKLRGNVRHGVVSSPTL
jgi:hypothetical protein